MNLYDLSALLDADLILTRYANQSGRWTAQLERCETKDGNLLCTAYGNAKDTDAAINDYVQQIRGKLIVARATSTEFRRELTVPTDLEAAPRPVGTHTYHYHGEQGTYGPCAVCGEYRDHNSHWNRTSTKPEGTDR